MAASKNWQIQAGEPFPDPLEESAQRLRLPLPGRDYWLTADDFEVLMQVRAQPNQNAALKADLSEYLTVTVEAVTGDILIDWAMTGGDTRALEGNGGYYDLVVSDVGAVDGRALILMQGQIVVMATVTAAGEESL